MAKSKVTLTTILNEIKKRDARFDELDSKSDIRFQFLKEQIQTIDGKLESFRADTKEEFANIRAETKAEFTKVYGQLNGFRAETKEEFAKVHSKLNTIRDQTAHITERVVQLETDLKDHLEQ